LLLFLGGAGGATFLWASRCCSISLQQGRALSGFTLVVADPLAQLTLQSTPQTACLGNPACEFDTAAQYCKNIGEATPCSVFFDQVSCEKQDGCKYASFSCVRADGATTTSDPAVTVVTTQASVPACIRARDCLCTSVGRVCI